METKIDVKMKIAQIQETKFSISEKVLAGVDIEQDKINIQLGYGFNCDIESNRFAVNVNIEYKYIFTEVEESIVSLSVKSIFDIEDMSNHFEQGVGQFNDKSNLVPQMLSVAIGSTRGVLAAKVASTSLSKYPMPMIDMSILMNKTK